MREGAHSYFVAQARTMNYRNGEWFDVSVPSLLFEDLTYQEKQERGDEYRALTKSGHDVWQRAGACSESSFETAEQAVAALKAVRVRDLPRHRDYEFRVAARQDIRVTTPLPIPIDRIH